MREFQEGHGGQGGVLEAMKGAPDQAPACGGLRPHEEQLPMPWVSPIASHLDRSPARGGGHPAGVKRGSPGMLPGTDHLRQGEYGSQKQEVREQL
jgi:hypothetical protein